MSSDRPFYFFELSEESEVVLWWKILFWSAYRHTWRMDFPPQNEMWTPISPCIFFESGWGTEVVFGCLVTDWTVYRHTFRKDWGPKDGIWVQTDLFIFRVRLGYRGRFWMFNHWLDCIQTYVQEGLYIQKRDMCPERPISFFELSGESEVVLWWKILFGTVYRHTWGMNFTTNRIWPRIRPLFFELSGESEVVLWWKILFGTVYRHTWGMNFCHKTRYEPRSAPLFFRAKRGFRGRFGVKNPIRNCI